MQNPKSTHYNRELNGSYSVAQRLLPRHHRVMDLHIRGLNARQISDELKMSYRQVHNLLNTPQFQNKASIRNQSIMDQSDQEIIIEKDSVNKLIKEHAFHAAQKLA